MGSEHTSSSGLQEQLSRNSTPYVDTLTRVDWESLSNDAFWLPEAALSLYGLPEYERLPEARRRALSQLEFLHLLEAGLWLEGIFMQRLSRAARRAEGDLSRRVYHLHELREEAGHSLMFLEVMRRSGLPRPRTRFRQLRLANALARFAPFDSFAFWIAVLIGEEVPDRLNRFVRKHREATCPAVYQITKIHIIDEARHIAHARDLLERRLARMSALRLRLLRPLIRAVFRDFVRALYFPTAHLYELAGLRDATEWAHAARRNPQRIRFVDECISSTLRTLQEHDIRLDWR